MIVLAQASSLESVFSCRGWRCAVEDQAASFDTGQAKAGMEPDLARPGVRGCHLARTVPRRSGVVGEHCEGHEGCD